MARQSSKTQHDDQSASDSPDSEHDRRQKQRVSLTNWVATHMTWSWFTCTQSTGGIAILLSLSPKTFSGLDTIGAIIFIFNIVLWLIFTALMLMRWTLNPSTIRSSFVTAPECFFFGSFWLTIATHIINIQRYGVPNCGYWLVVVVRILFWTYAAITLLSTTLHFVAIANSTSITAMEFNPAMFLLIFNAMLTGTVASAIAQSQPPSQRLPILVAGVGYQGLGFLISLLFLSFFIMHMLEKGWPAHSQRPALFMPIGATGYTIVCLIGCARAIPTGYAYFATYPMAPQILMVMATWVGVFLWILMLWLFGLALFTNLAGVVERKDGKWTLPFSFANGWWALIFPNVGFAIATIYLAEDLQTNAGEWVSVVMILLLVFFWLFDLALMAKAIVLSLFVDARIKLD